VGLLSIQGRTLSFGSDLDCTLSRGYGLIWNYQMWITILEFALCWCFTKCLCALWFTV